MRITRKLLEQTISNLNKHHLKKRNLIVLFHTYKPDKRILYKLMLAENPSAFYLRSTDFITVDKAYYWLVGMINFLDAEESRNRMKRFIERSDKQ